MTDTTNDPHSLLASGEELATEAELARMLGVSRAALASLLKGPMYLLVRYVDAKPAHRRYSVTDARLAIAPHMADLLERRRLADEKQAADRAAAAARRGDRQKAHAAHVAAKARKRPPKEAAPVSSSRPVHGAAKQRGGPEVIVRRRQGS